MVLFFLAGENPRQKETKNVPHFDSAREILP